MTDSSLCLILTKVTGQLAGGRYRIDSRRMQNHFIVSPLQQGQPDSPSESRKQWLDLCGDIYGAEKGEDRATLRWLLKSG